MDIKELINDLEGSSMEDHVAWLDMAMDIASLRTLGPGDPGYHEWIRRTLDNYRPKEES